MSQFDELLAQLKAEEEQNSTLAKALPAEDGEDDEAIQAAAADGDTDADNENPEDHEEPDGDEGKGGKPLAKSVTAMVDGEEVEAIDATDMLKSLEARVNEHDSVLAKALTSTLATVKAQGDLIKSLQAEVKKLAGKGAGRKTVLSIVEKPAAGEQVMAKSEQDGMTPQQFMAKANAAFTAGKLTGKELTTLDVAIRNGQIGNFGELVAKALA